MAEILSLIVLMKKLSKIGQYKDLISGLGE